MLRREVTHATDLDLLTVLIGDRKKATKLFAKAKFSLFSLLHSEPHENGDLFCAEGSSGRSPLRSPGSALENAVVRDCPTRDRCRSQGTAARHLAGARR